LARLPTQRRLFFGAIVLVSYASKIEVADSARTIRVRLLRGDTPLSWADVVDLWQGGHEFRRYFISILAEAPFPAYFWETPPIAGTTMDRDFEFVLVDSHHLGDVQADQQAFANHFSAAESNTPVLEFSNLGGDATLVVPRPLGSVSAYPHIGSFSKLAPEDQQHQLWQCVGAAISRRLGPQPLWVSTSGLGVYWLHIRIDSAPKYYTYAPYRS
jgi:hypothetical protein